MSQNSAANPSNPRRSGSGRNALVTRLLIAATLLGLLVCVVSVGAAVYLLSRGGGTPVNDGSFLRVELSGTIPDAPVQGGLFMSPDDIPPVGTEIADAIRGAATDDRIDGLYLELSSPSYGGWGTLQELRTAVQDFQAAGKPCVVYAETYSTTDYYLASACESVVLAPSGLMMVAGLSVSQTYYAEALEKLHIEPEFEHVGDFKTGPEPYVRSVPSDEAVEALDTLLDSLYGQLVAGVAASRDLDPEQLREFIDHPELLPHVAVERGLVDAVAFPDVVERRLRDASREDFATLLGTATDVAEGAGEGAVTGPSTEDVDDEDLFTPVRKYVKSRRAEQARRSDRIAVVHADGSIVSGDAGGGLFSEPLLTDGAFRDWMEEVREDDAIDAVVLRVNSPGGSGLASDMMWREIERTREAGKPVVVSMGDYAASGGYYISAHADWIVAQPGTLTGSIGVFGGKFNLAGAFEKLGIRVHHFARGENANLLGMDSGFTEEGREIYRGFLEAFYDRFVTLVADGRDMTFEEAHAVARGRVWTGEQALERGLVDELGGLHVAVAKAAELAGIEEYGVVRVPEQKPFFEVLMDDLSNARAQGLTVDVELPVGQEAVNELMVLEAVLADGVAAQLPGRLTIE